MAHDDVVVIGGGISGFAAAYKAQQAGRRVLVLEREPRIGGCLDSQRRDDFWYELGAHSTYNSYGGFLELAAGTGVDKQILERGPARARFGLLRGGAYQWLSPPKVLLLLNWLEAAVHAPVGLFRKKEGKSVAEYYGGLVGSRNYARVFSPFFAAVPSQSADGFPVEGDGSLFKKRPRNEAYPRSFGFQGGLQAVCEGVARLPNVTVETSVTVRRVAKVEGGFEVETSDGRTLEARLAILAVPPDAAAQMVEASFPELAQVLRRVRTVSVESLGVVVPKEKAWMPPCAFVVPTGDVLRSVVTRDPFPDETRRAFAFHFQEGTPKEQKLQRMSEVLRMPLEDLGPIDEKRVTLPAPAVGHGDLVSAIEQAVADTGLGVTGNYFAGLAIEDCVQRSFSEWARLTGSAEGETAQAA